MWKKCKTRSSNHRFKKENFSRLPRPCSSSVCAELWEQWEVQTPRPHSADVKETAKAESLLLLLLIPHKFPFVFHTRYTSESNLECWIGSYFFLPFSRSEVVMKKSSNDIYFVQREALGEKIIIWVKYGIVFTQMMIFSLEKVHNLRARGKRIHKSAPWSSLGS